MVNLGKRIREFWGLLKVFSKFEIISKYFQKLLNKIIIKIDKSKGTFYFYLVVVPIKKKSKPKLKHMNELRAFSLFLYFSVFYFFLISAMKAPKFICIINIQIGAHLWSVFLQVLWSYLLTWCRDKDLEDEIRIVT